MILDLNKENTISFTMTMNGSDRLETSEVFFRIITEHLVLSFPMQKDGNKFSTTINKMDHLLEAKDYESSIDVKLGTRLFTPISQVVTFVSDSLELDIPDLEIEPKMDIDDTMNLQTDFTERDPDNFDMDVFDEALEEVKIPLVDPLVERKNPKSKRSITILEQINSVIKTKDVTQSKEIPEIPKFKFNLKESNLKPFNLSEVNREMKEDIRADIKEAISNIKAPKELKKVVRKNTVKKEESIFKKTGKIEESIFKKTGKIEENCNKTHKVPEVKKSKKPKKRSKKSSTPKSTVQIKKSKMVEG